MKAKRKRDDISIEEELSDIPPKKRTRTSNSRRVRRHAVAVPSATQDDDPTNDLFRHFNILNQPKSIIHAQKNCNKRDDIDTCERDHDQHNEDKASNWDDMEEDFDLDEAAHGKLSPKQL